MLMSCKTLNCFSFLTDNNAYAAAVNGDVLAGGQERTRVISPKHQAKSTGKPSFLAWRS